MAFISVIFFIWENRKLVKAWSRSDILIKNAEEKKEKLIEKSKLEADEIISLAKAESNEIIKKSRKIEERILEREEKIEIRLEQIEKKQENIFEKEEKIKKIKERLIEKEVELDWKLSEIAELSKKEARELFLKQIWEKYEDDALEIITKHKKKIENDKKEISKDIILKSIQQYAWDVTSEVTTTIISIPSDDIKWKLIWKEW